MHVQENSAHSSLLRHSLLRLWFCASLCIVICLVLSSCTSGSGSEKGVVKIVTETQQTPLPACTTPKHASGESYGALTSGGIKRTFLLHLAPSYGQHPQALVLAYHGYSWSAKQMKDVTHLDQKANQAGFVLVLPQGVDDPPSWNAGVGAYGPTGDADDIQFARDLLTYLQQNYCVDMQRVYVTGFSLGSGMAYRVACTLTTQIAAVATVSGAYYPFGGCKAKRSLPVMEIHGAADELAPYDGNDARRMAAVSTYLQVWRQLDHCQAAAQVILENAEVVGTRWSHCAPQTEVVHYKIVHGGHSWPGVAILDTDAVIWQFFVRFSLPQK